MEKGIDLIEEFSTSLKKTVEKNGGNLYGYVVDFMTDMEDKYNVFLSPFLTDEDANVLCTLKSISKDDIKFGFIAEYDDGSFIGGDMEYVVNGNVIDIKDIKKYEKIEEFEGKSYFDELSMIYGERTISEYFKENDLDESDPEVMDNLDVYSKLILRKDKLERILG